MQVITVIEMEILLTRYVVQTRRGKAGLFIFCIIIMVFLNPYYMGLGFYNLVQFGFKPNKIDSLNNSSMYT